MMEKYEKLMQICLDEALKYRFDVAPNPMVAAIVYDENEDKIVSLGVHKKFGENHAEVNAVENAAQVEIKKSSDGNYYYYTNFQNILMMTGLKS